ncbi:hypothetical protein ACFW9D_27435 [Streptomyces sp. NPDC059524]|uniref:hypothetical protein n=1 Tax=Streptomyces sp. NPDC059524 TaxID=3346856 RepID=UPI003682FEE6
MWSSKWWQQCRPSGLFPARRLDLADPPRSGKTTYAREPGADSVTVDEALFRGYLAKFEEPSGEGEELVVRSPS